MLEQAGTYLSLIYAPQKSPSNLAERASHPAHLGITLASPNDVDALYARLRAAGLRVQSPKLHRDRSYGFYLADPDGNQLECIFIPALPPPPAVASAKTGALFVVHGARDPRWMQPFSELLPRLRAHLQGYEVELACMEMSEPRVPEGAARLVSSGCREIILLPLFLSSGGHVAHDFPEILAELESRYPQIRFRSLPALGEALEAHEGLIAAAANALRSRA
jgi:sirohydrochlorin cobaltochelatase